MRGAYDAALAAKVPVRSQTGPVRISPKPCDAVDSVPIAAQSWSGE